MSSSVTPVGLFGGSMHQDRLNKTRGCNMYGVVRTHLDALTPVPPSENFTLSMTSQDHDSRAFWGPKRRRMLLTFYRLTLRAGMDVKIHNDNQLGTRQVATEPSFIGAEATFPDHHAKLLLISALCFQSRKQCDYTESS
eukprot:4899247-Amphidinium_carterae.1